jgi:hypothetical protein
MDRTCPFATQLALPEKQIEPAPGKRNPIWIKKLLSGGLLLKGVS